MAVFDKSLCLGHRAETSVPSKSGPSHKIPIMTDERQQKAQTVHLLSAETYFEMHQLEESLRRGRHNLFSNCTGEECK